MDHNLDISQGAVMPVLPGYQQLADAANFLAQHARGMHNSGHRVVQDLEGIANNLRSEQGHLEREFQDKIERNHSYLTMVEAMIDFYRGPEPQVEMVQAHPMIGHNKRGFSKLLSLTKNQR